MKKINNYFEAEQIGESILHIRLLPIIPSIKENKELLTMMSTLIESQPIGQKGVFIFNCESLKLIGSEIRIQSGQWAKENNLLFRQSLHAILFYNAGLILEFVIKGVFLFSKPPVPVLTLKNKDESFLKANELLKG